METFDDQKYDCLSEDMYREFVEDGYTPESLERENNERRDEIERFLQRNILLKYHGSLKNEGNPVNSHVFVFGYEHEGKHEIESILKSANSVSAHQFNFEFIKGTITRNEISNEFCREIENVKCRMKQVGVPTVFLMVMNCSIHTSDTINEQARDKLLNVLGPEVLLRCVLVLTYGKDILKEKLLEEHYDEITNGATWVSRLYNRFYPRLIVVDINENSTYGRCCQRNQIERLLLCASGRFDKPVGTNWKVKCLSCMVGIGLASILWGLAIFIFSYLIPKSHGVSP